MDYNFSLRDKRYISANCYFSGGVPKETYINKILGKKVNQIIRVYRNYNLRKRNIEYKKKLKLYFYNHILIPNDIIDLIFEKKKYFSGY